jgi:hypothetical protein
MFDSVIPSKLDEMAEFNETINILKTNGNQWNFVFHLKRIEIRRGKIGV